MRTHLFSGMLLVAGVATGCASLDVGTNYDWDAPFGSYRTYGWSLAEIECQDCATDPLQLDTWVREAIDRQLGAMGYRQAEGTTDFVIRYYLGVKNQSQMLPTFTFEGSDFQETGPGLEQELFEYREGTLIIDFLDGSNARLVWRGWAHGAVDKKTPPPAEIRERISEAVAEILEAFPPEVLAGG